MSRPSDAACPAHIGEKSPEPCASALARSGERAGGQWKFGRHLGYRADLAHQAIDEAARRTAGHEIGQRRAVIARGFERGAMRRRDLRLRTPQIRRADLHAGGPEREGSRDAARVGDAARGNDRHLHRIDDLRNERKRAGLSGDVVAQKDATMAAGLAALRDHGIDAARFEPARLGGGGRRAHHQETSRLEPP